MFFFKQKTADWMRISDWSSDVCSSDLLARFLPRFLRPVPLPDDVVQREIDRIEEIETMRLWRTPRQVVAEEIEDDGLRRVLDSLAIALEKQESQKNGQPLL